MSKIIVKAHNWKYISILCLQSPSRDLPRDYSRMWQYVLQRLPSTSTKSRVAKHCPSCRTPISSELKTNFTVKKLVENLEAKWDLCQLEGKIEQLANHKCPEEEIKCENGQCSTKVKRKDQERHAEECIFKVVFCERCHRSTTVARRHVRKVKLTVQLSVRVQKGMFDLTNLNSITLTFIR